jgi:4-hydroxy-tetrahydrodipicolinate synthase
MFAESNPGPVKYALSQLGFGANAVRLPLVTVSAPTAQKIEAAMREVGLLN